MTWVQAVCHVAIGNHTEHFPFDVQIETYNVRTITALQIKEGYNDNVNMNKRYRINAMETLSCPMRRITRIQRKVTVVSLDICTT